MKKFNLLSVLSKLTILALVVLLSGCFSHSTDESAEIKANEPLEVTINPADAPSDVTPPAAVTGFPSLITVDELKASIDVNINEKGMIYYVLLPNKSATPSALQIKTGLNANGASALKGSFLNTLGNTKQILVITGLASNTEYEVFIEGVDSAGNIQSTPNWIHLKTKDFTAPTTIIELNTITDTSAAIYLTASEASTIYYELLNNKALSPTAAQLKAGLDSKNLPANSTGTLSSIGKTKELILISNLTLNTEYELYAVSEDINGNLQRVVSKLHIRTKDFTPPINITAYPAVSNISEVSLSFANKISESGKIYYLVLPNGATAPTSTQVKSGLDSTNNVTKYKGFKATNGNLVETITVTGLVGLTDYDIFVVAEDSFGNLQTSVTTLHVKTKDFTPPTTQLELSSIVETSATIAGTVNEAGTIYYELLPNKAPIPTPAQIKAGLDSKNVESLNKGTIVSTGKIKENMVVSGLVLKTDYEFYAVSEDASGNLQKTTSKLHITTKDLTPPVNASAYPAIGSVSEVSTTLQHKISEAGKIYYEILPNGSTAPTPSQIKNGLDSSNIYVKYKGVKTSVGNVVDSIIVTGLVALTEYEVFLVAEDIFGNLQKSVDSFHIKTKDFTPPLNISGYPQLTSTNENNATITLFTNEKSVIYYELLSKNAALPSAAQVKTGVDLNNLNAISKGTLSTNGNVKEIITVTGLLINTEYELYIVAEDTFGNLQKTPSKLHIKTIDKTPPLYNIGFPNISVLSETNLTLNANISEAGKIYFGLVSNGSTTPTSLQLKSGLNSSNTPIIKKGIITTTGNKSESIVISSLLANTEYELYIVGEDLIGNLQTTPTRLHIKTIDSTPPLNINGYPSISAMTVNSASIFADINEKGVIYYVLLSANSSAPTSLQIKSGKDSSGASCSIKGNIATNGNTAETITITGLSAGNEYELFLVSEDGNGNIQATPSKLHLVTTTQNSSSSSGNSFTYNSTTYNGKGKIVNSASNQVYAEPNITITEPKEKSFEADAFFYLRGTISATGSNQYSWVRVTKNDTKEETSYWIRGTFNKRVWLRFGAGDYTVTVHKVQLTSNNLNYEGDLLSWYYWSSIYSFTVKNTRNEDGKFIYPSDAVQSDDSSISSLTQSVISGSSTIDDKIKAIHDYVVKYLYYDMASLNPGARKKQDAVSTLNNKTAVCEGYTSLFNAMLRSAGIKAKCVAGTGYTGSGSGLHAWSNVMKNATWYFVDTTWDDPAGQNSTTVYYTYYMLTNLSGKNNDHAVSSDRPERAPGRISDSYPKYYEAKGNSGGEGSLVGFPEGVY